MPVDSIVFFPNRKPSEPYLILLSAWLHVHCALLIAVVQLDLKGDDVVLLHEIVYIRQTGHTELERLVRVVRVQQIVVVLALDQATIVLLLRIETANGSRHHSIEYEREHIVHLDGALRQFAYHIRRVSSVVELANELDLLTECQIMKIAFKNTVAATEEEDCGRMWKIVED